MNTKVTVNGRVYAESIVDTLFEPGGTAYGEFVKVDGGAYFFDGKGLLEAFLVANKHNEYFFVSATAYSEGVRFMHALATHRQEQFSSGSYSRDHEICEELWAAMRDVSPRSKGYATKKAKAGQFKANCEYLGTTVDAAKNEGQTFEIVEDRVRHEQIRRANEAYRARFAVACKLV